VRSRISEDLRSYKSHRSVFEATVRACGCEAGDAARVVRRRAHRDQHPADLARLAPRMTEASAADLAVVIVNYETGG